MAATSGVIREGEILTFWNIKMSLAIRNYLVVWPNFEPIGHIFILEN